MNAVTQTQAPSVVIRIADRYQVDRDKLLTTLKATAFKAEKPVSNEQMMALLIVADQYHLNPFTREIFAFDDKRSGIVPVVSVDGWARILNDHPAFDGLEFAFGPDDERGQVPVPTWCECTIYRKDRSHPIRVREFFSEVRRDTGPWKSHPRRMLRHKTLIQCARVALGFSGIYDEDEAQRIVAGEAIAVSIPPQATRTEQAKALLSRQEETSDAPTMPDLAIADEAAAPPPEWIPPAGSVAEDE